MTFVAKDRLSDSTAHSYNRNVWICRARGTMSSRPEKEPTSATRGGPNTGTPTRAAELQDSSVGPTAPRRWGLQDTWGNVWRSNTGGTLAPLMRPQTNWGHLLEETAATQRRAAAQTVAAWGIIITGRCFLHVFLHYPQTKLIKLICFDALLLTLNNHNRLQ